MNKKKNLTALIFGATGLVGSELLNRLLSDKHYEKIYVANRRLINYSSEKIEEFTVNFDHLEKYKKYFQVDHLFICLGTTIKNAGSKEKFEKVDLEYPVKIAEMARSAKVNVLIHISALGANSNSSNFYTRTKGKAQEQIEAVGPDKTYAVQPSLLLGDRDEKRTGERIGQFFMKNLEFLMVGPLKKYRAIHASEVAGAMLNIALNLPEEKRIESEKLKVISKQK